MTEKSIIPDGQNTQGAALTINRPSMLDAVVALGREAQSFGVRVLEMQEPINGLPNRVAVGERTGASPEMFSLRDYFEAYRSAPERRKGQARATTLASFVALANRHKDAHSVIFAETRMPNPSLRAVINYHHRADADFPNPARFGDHRIVYEFPLTDEFKTWMAQNGKAMPQADFALFIEDHVTEIAAASPEEAAQFEPLFKERFATPGDLIALSRSLEITVGCKVKRKEILKSGERAIVFEDEHKTAAGETIDIPGIFMLCLPPFIGGEVLRMPARLRYRIAGGDVLWSYQLYKPDFWLREHVRANLAEAAAETGLPAFEGAPEA